MTRKVLNKRKVFYFISLLTMSLLLFITGLKLYSDFHNKNKQPENIKKQVDSIELYGYTLSDNATDLYKEYFNELKTVLNTSPLDEKKYSEIVVKAFVTDFYTLDNKITSTDIGGTEFIHPDLVDNFMMNAGDTIYDSVESNLYNERTQDLPVVSNVTVNNVEETEYTYNDNKYKGYKIECSWEYESDMGYDKSATFVVVKVDSKYYIVEN